MDFDFDDDSFDLDDVLDYIEYEETTKGVIPDDEEFFDLELDDDDDLDEID